MQVTGIRIHNILGIADLEIAPGRVTVIEGPNATGKTSVIKALQAVVGGGHDATLLRHGADEGEIVLVVDDNGDEYKVRKRVRPDKSDLTVESAEYGKLPKAKGWLDRLVERASFNPVAFLTAPAKDRVDALLAAVPAPADPDAIAAVVGTWIKGAADLEGPALSVLGHVRELVFLRRRERNREARDKHATVTQLQEGLPPAAGADGADLDTEEANLRAKLSNLRDVYRQDLDAVAVREDAACQAADQAYEAAILEAAKVRDQAKTAAKAAADDACNEIRKAQEPEMNLLDKRITELEALAKAAAKAQGARDQVARMAEEASAAKEQAEAMTAALEALDAMKGELLGTIPIAGLAVRDGEVYIGETAFDQMSTAERTRLAFEIAKLRAGQLGLVAVDGLEALDAESLKAFEASARAAEGLQLVYTRVLQDGAFGVRAEA